MPAGVRAVAALVTSLGTSGYMFATSAGVAVVAWRFGRTARDRRVRVRMRRWRDGALHVFVAVAASGLAAQVVKHVVGRVRPGFAGPSGPLSFHPWSAANAFASFPSGHATSAFAAAAVLGSLVPRARPALLLLAGAIGASRVVVGAHYPSDVVCGAALGTVVALTLARTATAAVLAGARRASAATPPDPVRPAGPAEKPGRSWDLVLGRFLLRHRRLGLPALAAGLFAAAIPPADLFGSAAAEHVKDGCAVLIAVAGLTLRSLAAGVDRARPGRDDRAPVPATDGAHALGRHPVHAGTALIFAGLFLMHGDRWVVLLGTAASVLVHLAIVRAEEDDLIRRFGPAYADYAARVPRWPDPTRLGRASRGLRFDLRGALDAEHPVIGLTVIALAVAEFYEEIEEPLAAGRAVGLDVLGAIILGVAALLGALRLARGRRPTLDAR